jgi:hypothetical protein
MARTHSHEALQHAVHRTSHEQLKRHHHTIIAYWNILLKALGCAVEVAPPAARAGLVAPK